MTKNRKNWAGIISVQHRRGLFFGSAGSTDIHTSHGLKICFAIGNGGSFRFRSGKSDKWHLCEAVIIAAEQLHQINGDGENLALFYLTPETSEAVQAAEIYLNDNHGFAELSRNMFSDLAARLSFLLNQNFCTGIEAVKLFEQMIRDLNLMPSVSLRHNLDERVKLAIEYLESKIEDKIPIEEIARNIGASESRLAHVFKDETNTTIRRYHIWLKLCAAIKSMSFSDSTNYIANANGFFDQSHFNKYFLKMHGILPSALLRYSKFINNDDG